MHENLIEKMRARVAQCRRLASHTTDESTARILRDMADEGEADLRRLEAERRQSRDAEADKA